MANGPHSGSEAVAGGQDGDKAPSSDANFLETTVESADLNQYWFSQRTIQTFVGEILEAGGTAALVSSPSVYFSLPPEVRSRCRVLDFDRQWASDPGFVFYDFHEPEQLPPGLCGACDFVLIDPPFITAEVWVQYAATAKLLLRPPAAAAGDGTSSASTGGRVLCTTIAENATLMWDLLGLRPVRFRPSIPTLVYQYSTYTNYSSERLDQLNPEVDDEDWMLQVSQASAENAAKDRPQACKPSLGCKLPEASEIAPAAAVDPAPASPAVQLLTELRERLNVLKRATEALHPALQLEARRRQSGGEVAASAAAKADSALEAARVASVELQGWLQTHAAEAQTALGESEEGFARSLAQDRWRTQAVADLVAKARAQKSVAAGGATRLGGDEVATAARQHAAAIFRLSNTVLDRIKVLKREECASTAAAARAAPV